MDPMPAVWRALANPVRREILDLLRAGPRTTGDVASHFPSLSRFAVMQHLGVLTAAGLVRARREGRERWNHLDPTPIRLIYERWVSRYDEPILATLTGLKTRAEAASVAAPLPKGRSRRSGGRRAPKSPRGQETRR